MTCPVCGQQRHIGECPQLLEEYEQTFNDVDRDERDGGDGE